MFYQWDFIHFTKLTKYSLKKFFFQINTHSLINQLEEEMALLYANDRFDIFIPWINRCCAVSWETGFRRGKILKELPDDTYETQLVDYGIKITCKYDALKPLDQSFYEQPIALCCSLKDIVPKCVGKRSVSWSKQACDFLQKLLFNTKTCKYQVIVHPDTNILKITLNRYEGGVGGSGTTVYCINTQLVVNGFAVSNGPESERQPKEEKTEETLQSAGTSVKTMKETVHKRYGDYCHISYSKTPSEFYLTFEREKDNLENLHETIQRLMNQTNLKLKRGVDALTILDRRYCLVQAVIAPTFYPSWFRGKIVSAKDDEYQVYLRDNGQTVAVAEDKISEIPKEINDFACGVQKCSLACVKPVAGLLSWTQTAIDLFNTKIRLYQRLCVTIHGKIEEDGNFPVILYGMKVIAKNPLSADTHQWTQLNEDLVMNGVAKRVGTYVAPDISSNDGDSSRVKSATQLFREMQANEKGRNANGDIYIDTEIRQIDAWPAAKQIKKTTFTCTPTYVDDDSNVYIQDTEYSQDIALLKSVINAKMQEIGEGNFKPVPKDCKDVPCLVKFHVDKLYYRGKILRYIPKTDRYEVEFVDYGNTDECITEKEICLDVVAHNVPLFAKRVRLVGKSHLRKLFKVVIQLVLHI